MTSLCGNLVTASSSPPSLPIVNTAVKHRAFLSTVVQVGPTHDHEVVETPADFAAVCN